MLSSKERLRRANLFTKTYSARKSISTPLFTLYVLPRISKTRTDQPFPLVGFVTSKKTCKSACKRNRMKRRVREAYRKLRDSSLTQWYTLVLVIKESALKAPWDDMCKTMKNALSEAASRYSRN